MTACALYRFKCNYTVSQKVPTFKLSVTLPNLNRFSEFLHCWNVCEVATKATHHYPPHLRHVATLPWYIKNSNFLHADIQQIWKKCKQHFQCTDAECIYVFPSKSCSRRWMHVDCWQTLQWHLLLRIYSGTDWSQRLIAKVNE